MAGDASGTIYLWSKLPSAIAEPSMHAAEKRWKAHDGPVSGLLFEKKAGNEWSLVSAGLDGIVQRWTAEGSRSAQPRFERVDVGNAPDHRPIVALAQSPDGMSIAVGRLDGTIHLWASATGKLIGTIEAPKDRSHAYALHALGFSGDGRYLAIGASDNEKGVILNELVEISVPGKPRRLKDRLKDHHEGILAFARGSDSKHWLASVAQDGQVLTWTSEAVNEPKLGRGQFEQRMTAAVGKGGLSAIDMSADGALTLVGGDHGLVHLWDTTKDAMLIGSGFKGHGDERVSAVAIAPQSDFFVTAARKKVLLWPGPSTWADIACRKLHGNMTDEQWGNWVSMTIKKKEQCPNLAVPSKTQIQ